MNIGCIVLAGGKSERLGRDKVREIVGNQSLLQRVINSVSFLGNEIIVVFGEKQPSLPPISYPRMRIVTDILPGRGSLGGIYTGLAVSNSFYNLVVACDMPFLNRTLLEYMMQISVDYDIVVPRLENSVEPLHAIYSRNCLAPIEDLLRRDRLQIIEFFPSVRVRYVDTEEINRFDPGHMSFFNVNKQADLETARELAERGMGDDKR